MNNFREVNDDMLKDWLEFRDQTEFAYMTKEDKKHMIYFDEICEKIISYWNEKYYRNGFCDAIELIVRCI